MRILHRISLAVGLTIGVGASALAADMPAARKAAPIPAPLVYNWSGLYAGANAGYGWGRPSSDGVSLGDMNGFVGGGQIGYNWQAGALVFGVEADYQGTAQKRSDSGVVLGVPFTVEQQLPWFGTARGRVGGAWDNMLLYATLGAAWVNYEISVSALGTTVTSDSTKAALAGGAGLEYMFAPRWSGKLEYLYVDTGNTSVTLFGVTVNGRMKDHIARAGLNYHF